LIHLFKEKLFLKSKAILNADKGRCTQMKDSSAKAIIYRDEGDKGDGLGARTKAFNSLQTKPKKYYLDGHD